MNSSYVFLVKLSNGKNSDSWPRKLKSWRFILPKQKYAFFFSFLAETVTVTNTLHFFLDLIENWAYHLNLNLN